MNGVLTLFFLCLGLLALVFVTFTKDDGDGNHD